MFAVKNKVFLPFVLIVFVLSLDLFSKAFIHQNITPMEMAQPIYPYGGIGVFENALGIEFSITHAKNKGAAWGIFSDWQQVLSLLRIILVTGLVIYLIAFNQNHKWRFPLALIIAGATGNIVDTYLYGHVVDMFHFVLWGYDYPIFNVADCSIFLGVSWILLNSFLEKSRTCPR